MFLGFKETRDPARSWIFDAVTQESLQPLQIRRNIESKRRVNKKQSQETTVFAAKEGMDDYGNAPGRVVPLPQGESEDGAFKKKKRAFEFI